MRGVARALVMSNCKDALCIGAAINTPTLAPQHYQIAVTIAPEPILSRHGPSAAVFTARRKWTDKIRERLSDRLLDLCEHLCIRFEELVIIALSHDQCRFIRLLNDRDAVFRRQGRDERDRLFDVGHLASEAAVASKEAGRIDARRAHRLDLLDIALLLERGNALQAVRIADRADRIIFDAELIEALAERLDAFRNEVGDQTLGGHAERTQILERKPVVAG